MVVTRLTSGGTASGRLLQQLEHQQTKDRPYARFRNELPVLDTRPLHLKIV
jgi:hypothetical protein